MGRPLQQLQRFFRELKRRNVYKVAIAYVAVAFVVLQGARLLVPALVLPEWFYRVVVALALLGFPLALVVAWAFEVTPEGVRRTAEAEPSEGMPEAEAGTRPVYKVLIGLGLVAAAVAGGWYMTGGGGQSPEVSDRSVAVLPFKSVGGGTGKQMAQGVHDDLITRLSTVADLRVISRTSVERYRTTNQSLPVIARELDVSWIVEGTVQQAEDRIRVNAQLFDARDDDSRWAESYQQDLTAENLFAIQGDLTKRIASSLQAELSPREKERVERQPTENLKAYRLYVEGRVHLDRRTESGMRRGMELFHRAIAEDSSYAPAWSGLADSRSLLVSYGHASSDSLINLALAAARRAVELDANLAEAHASLGLVFSVRPNGPAAIRELRRAVELRPSYARSHHWLGVQELAVADHLRSGLASLERAATLDPMSPPVHAALAIRYLFAGRTNAGLAAAERSLELSPDYPEASIAHGAALIKLDEFEDGLVMLQTGLESAGAGSAVREVFLGWPGLAYSRMGREDLARTYLKTLEEEDASPLARALVLTALGDNEAAFSNLREVRWTYISLTMLRYEEAFSPLRKGERYRKLIRKINQEWGLDPDGSLPDSVDVSFEAQSDE